MPGFIIMKTTITGKESECMVAYNKRKEIKKQIKRNKIDKLLENLVNKDKLKELKQ